MLILGGLEVLGGRQLHDLALGDDGGGGGKNVERLQRADIDHHAERLAEQEVADENARLVAPDHAGCLLAPAHAAFVDHVVMQQGCRVHELDAGGELDVAFAGIAEHLRGGQGDHWPKPLAAGRNQVIGDFRDHFDVGTGLGQDELVHPAHVGGRQVDQLSDRRGLALAVFEIENYAHEILPSLNPFSTERHPDMI